MRPYSLRLSTTAKRGIDPALAHVLAADVSIGSERCTGRELPEGKGIRWVRQIAQVESTKNVIGKPGNPSIFFNDANVNSFSDALWHLRQYWPNPEF